VGYVSVGLGEFDYIRVEILEGKGFTTLVTGPRHGLLRRDIYGSHAEELSSLVIHNKEIIRKATQRYFVAL
jgi:hypothetical protein